MLTSFLSHRTAVAGALALVMASMFGVWQSMRAQSGGPSTVNTVCTSGQLDYWSWDHYTRLWSHRCLIGGEKILASEGDIVALAKNQVTSIVDSASQPVVVGTEGQPSLIDSDPSHVDVGLLTTPTLGDAPQMSMVASGGLKKSSSCRPGGVLQDANTGIIPQSTEAGCNHGTTNPTDDDANAVDEAGSVGVYTVQWGGPAGPTFTWDVSRWAKGDIMLGVGDAFMKAFDRDLKFKRYIALSDHQRLTAGGFQDGEWVLKVPGPNAVAYDKNDPTSHTSVYPDALGDPDAPDQPSLLHPTGRQTAGCGVDFRTGEPYFANFDFYDPGINVVTRQAGNTMSPAHGTLPYSDLSKRISTADFRAGDTAGRNVIDNTPESVKFDRNLNLYIGHEQPWYTGDGMVVDKDAPLEAAGLVAPAGHTVFDSYDAQTVYLGTFDSEGKWTSTGNLIEDSEGFYDSVRMRRDPGDSLHPYEAYFENVRVPYLSGNALDPGPFAWLYSALPEIATNRIPWPRVYGRRLHRYVYNASAAQPWSRSNAEFHWPFTARTGIDWIDLVAPTAADAASNRKPVVIYTSQTGDLYRYDTETGTQLSEWSTGRIFPSELHAFRLLPPGDGTDLVVAGLDRANDNPEQSFAYNTLMRVKIDPATRQARIVQKYTVPNVIVNGVSQQPQWKALDVSPDGETMVAVAAFSTNVYRFDIATGTYAILEGTGNASVRYESQSVCILWQYNAQQEICGNDADDDGDGIIDNACQSVPELSDTLVPADDFYSIPKNVTLVVGGSGVLVNDQASGPLSSSGVSSAPLHGVVTTNTNGSFIYVPTHGFVGQDQFKYLATTSHPFTGVPITKEATVTILIVNTPPVAADNSYTTQVNTPIDFRYAPCAGVQPIAGINHILPIVAGQDCVPDGAANVAAGVLVAGTPDSDPDNDAISIRQWGLGLLTLPGVFSDETWRDIPSDGGYKACAGISNGFTDAFCHTARGGTIEVWSDGRFRYFPPTGFTGEDYIYYRVSDGSATSNWARITITIEAAQVYPPPVAVGNAYETTTGFNLDVHYPPCIASPGQIEGVNFFPSNLNPNCPPNEANNPNAVNGILKLTDQVVGYVDADHVDSRGVPVLQLKPSVPLPTGTLQTDWSDDLSVTRVHSWGERQADMPGPLDLGTWNAPAVGDDVNVCRGMAQGTTDAYCPTKLGGSLELWRDGTFRYQPPDVASPRADWFWYRIQDGHGQVSNWAQVTINVNAKMQIRALPQTRVYGEAGPITNDVAYYDFMLAGQFTPIPQPLAARPGDMIDSSTCVAMDGGNPVTASTPVGLYPITCSGETRSGYKVTYVSSTLTITPALLTVNADNQNKAYGAPLPTLTYTIGGFVNGETLGTSGVTGTPSLSTTATAANPVLFGGYAITPVAGTLAATNYTFQYVPGTLTILAFANVRVEVVSVGGVGTFSFTNALPGGATSFTTLVAGAAVSSILPTVSAGSYQVTSTTMPAGFYLSSVACTGGGGNTVTALRTATIGVDPGEAIVCRFTFTKATASVGTGDTATIGYWRNNNGQALIKSLNGGPTATNLANWLAANFPYLYGPNSSHDMTGKTNVDVAALDVALFGSDKWAAQVLGGAIASYVTNSVLAGGSYSVPFGFNLSTTGTGAKLYNVGSQGTNVGLTNNASYTVEQLLWQANYMQQQGTYNSNAFNAIFSAINVKGDIK